MNQPPQLQPTNLRNQVIQSAINVSEGRNTAIIREIVETAAKFAIVADWSADVDHNRMVITILGDGDQITAGALAIAEIAVRRIDLNNHSGVHPRIGAVDVIPLTPIRDISMAECVVISREIGNQLARQFNLPVFLYEESAVSGGRLDLPTLRKGGFEALQNGKLVSEREPDFGPRCSHPTAGAVVLGARNPLIAWNVNLECDDVQVARQIAKQIRVSRVNTPTLIGVRALGLFLPSLGLAQVSMNVTKPDLTPLPPIYNFVSEAARERGVEIRESEIIGLLPLMKREYFEYDQLKWNFNLPSRTMSYWLAKL